MRRTRLLTLALLSMVTGCVNLGGESASLYRIRVGNRSSVELRSIVVDPDGLRGDFGYFGVGHPNSVKGAGFCQVRFSDGFAIEWNEAGQIKKQVIDIRRYEKKRRQIKSFGFFYLGNDKWEVVAQSGTKRDSSMVLP